jgi:3-phenylpropionate/cinnamic acid dioxygenase small subunit
MDGAIAGLLAKQEITEVIYRVARATDRGDVELYAACFHEDGADYHGLANGSVRNILAVLARSKLLLTQHAITNTLIDLDGDRARAESCFSSFHQSRDEQGKLWDEAIRGRYLDRLERRANGPWKIARRVVLWDWSRIEPSGETWVDRMRLRPGADDRYIFGRRDRQDMLYTDTLPVGFEEPTGGRHE